MTNRVCPSESLLALARFIPVPAWVLQGDTQGDVADQGQSPGGYTAVTYSVVLMYGSMVHALCSPTGLVGFVESEV